MIVENWNRLIQPEEIVFHVGDLALGKRENIEGLVHLLTGKLYLMRGNHDGAARAFISVWGSPWCQIHIEWTIFRIDADLLAPSHPAP
jgi:calcineurin-like phosphoesterase family protein